MRPHLPAAATGLAALTQPSILFGLAMTVLVWGGTLHQIETERAASERSVTESTLNLARLFEENVLRTLGEVDSTLRLIRYVYEIAERKPRWSDLITEAHTAAEITMQLSVIDARGRLIANNQGTPPPLDLSDREHFLVHKRSTQDHLFISKPVLGRLSKKWAVQVTRRFFEEDGRFGGVLVASLDPIYLTRFYDRLSLGEGGGIALIGADGIVRAGGGIRAEALGRHLGHTPQMQAEGVIVDRARNSVVVLHAVRGYPLVVRVETDLVQPDSSLARNQSRYLALAAGLTLLVLIGVLLGTRHQRRLVEARRAAARSAVLTRIKSRELEITLENISQGILMVDADQRIAVMNRQCARLLGLPEQFAAEQHTYRELIDRLSAAGEFSNAEATVEPGVLAYIREPEGSQVIPSYERVRPDGTVLRVRNCGLPDGGFVRTLTDVTTRRRNEAQIVHLARHDGLTGLANRALFRERVEAELQRANQGGGGFALHLVDLDRFKSVNDTFGHAVGDKLLKLVAGRLKAAVRRGDVVARLGGDEFAVIQAEVGTPAEAEALAARLCRTLAQAFPIDANQILIGGSVGVAMAPRDGADMHGLLKSADLALYAAKADGRNTWRVFQQEMCASREARLTLERDLKHALTAGEFELHYQPINSAQGQEITGFEALLRWRKPGQGLVPPLDFVPFAEETGLIVPIGSWVLETACKEMSRRPDHLRIAVNLSPVQFRNQDLVGIVERALRSSGLAPYRLELEITESMLLEKDPLTLSQLQRLRDLGVLIAMDDFGTGYSSLSYLLTYPVDRIKIDRTFVNALGEKRGSIAVVRAIITLAESLGMSTTAEGVETRAQLDQLHELGCREVQGFYFSPPKPAADILPAPTPMLEVVRKEVA